MHPSSPSFIWLHLAPPTSTQLNLPPLSSIHLHPAPSPFQPPPSSIHLDPLLSTLLEPKYRTYLGNFLKFSRKIQRCPFWLKIGTNGILEVLIPNPDLDFWNSNPKIHFLANFCRKSQSCPFCLKMYTHGISRIPILIPTSIFWISNHKSIFWGKYGPKKLKLSVLPENWYTWYLEDADSYSDISILNFKT